MAQWKPLGGGTVIALLLASTAQADVTAEQVWQSWKEFGASMGQTVTAASEEMSGDTLTVTGMSMTAAMPDGSMATTIDSVAFKELGDGTVEVTMSPSYPITITSTVEGKTTEVVLTVTQTDLAMIASGTETETAYEFAAASIGVVLDSITGDEAAEAAAAEVDFTLSGVEGGYLISKADLTTAETEFNAEALSFNVAASDPESTGSFTMTGEMQGVGSVSSFVYPPDIDTTDMAAALKAGFATDGALTYGATTFTFDFADPEAGQSAKATGSVASGGINFVMDQAQLGYDVSSQAIDATVSASDMPFPEVNAKLEEFGLALAMPLAQGTEPQDFSFVARLVGLAVSDEIWGMIDPAGALPRDPATAIVDLSGKANWLVDIMAMDPETPPTEAPGQIHALTLNALQLAIAGADLTGTGAFTFDNSDTTTFPGMPAPSGTVDLRLVGGNGLIDKLVAMGLVPEDQAMGARMMLGLFARPAEGEDTLTSQIEVKPDGSVFANGQQLQ